MENEKNLKPISKKKKRKSNRDEEIGLKKEEGEEEEEKERGKVDSLERRKTHPIDSILPAAFLLPSSFSRGKKGEKESEERRV